jgi:hypothetical protein
MSWEEFAAKMKRLSEGGESWDKEGTHVMMDQLMAETLKAHGYGEGIKIFQAYEKWYG